MTLQDFFIGLIALLVCGAMIYFFILPSAGTTVLPVPQLFVEVPPSVLPNQPISLTIAASASSGKIIGVESEGKTQTLSCAQDPCVFTIPLYFASSGQKTIVVTLDNLRAERLIDVTTIVSRCIDGTPEGECSAPPQFCKNSKLVSNCSICGCPAEKICVSDLCVNPPLSFSFISFSVPSTLYTNIPVNLPYQIQNTSGYSAEGLFLLVISAYDSSEKFIQENAQQVQLSALAPSDVYTSSIRVAFPSNTKYLRLRWYENASAYPASTLLAESERVNVNVTTDTTPPLPPSNPRFSPANGGFILEWDSSPSPDVSFYRIYQENFSTGGFTTYSILGQSSYSPFSLPSSSTPLAYAVRAVDGAGNESDATQPIVGGRLLD